MWTTRSERLANPVGTRFTLDRAGRPATWVEVLEGWRSDALFRTQFTTILAESPYTAFRWETPAVTSRTLTRSFEFVLLDSPGLARAPDREAFAEHFRSDADVVTFANLRGDATLVVPTPQGAPEYYGHLAAFLRSAPDSQHQALWIAVAEAMTRRISEKPVWLSTAGAGVSWLHVRLDDRPKYYGFQPYGIAP
jgi:hypothetical protein